MSKKNKSTDSVDTLTPQEAAKLIHNILSGKTNKLTQAKRRALSNTLLALGAVKNEDTGKAATYKDFISGKPKMYHIAFSLPARYDAELCVSVSGSLDIMLVRYGREKSSRSFVGSSGYVYMLEAEFETAIAYTLAKKTKDVTQFVNKLAALILLYGGKRREAPPKPQGVPFGTTPVTTGVKTITIAVSNRYVKQEESYDE